MTENLVDCHNSFWTSKISLYFFGKTSAEIRRKKIVVIPNSDNLLYSWCDCAFVNGFAKLQAANLTRSGTAHTKCKLIWTNAVCRLRNGCFCESRSAELESADWRRISFSKPAAYPMFTVCYLFWYNHWTVHQNYVPTVIAYINGNRIRIAKYLKLLHQLQVQMQARYRRSNMRYIHGFIHCRPSRRLSLHYTSWLMSSLWDATNYRASHDGRWQLQLPHSQ